MKEKFPMKDASLVMKECFVEGIKEFDLDILHQNTWSPSGDIQGVILLKDIMQKYLYKIKKEGMPNVIGVEVPYSFHHGDDVEVRGFIDRIDLVEPGHYEVVDYKTSKSPNYLSPKQLTIYAEAISRMYPDVKKLSGKYIMLKLSCDEIHWNFNKDDLNKIIKNIDKVSKEIKVDKTWIKKPTSLCNFCDYKSLCQDTWAEGE
jgi:CRISPR/Cas system-associated exonuclease Cas4 (RecB family)